MAAAAASQLPTNGNPLLPLPSAQPRQNVKHRLMVKKQDPVVPNPPSAQPKPTNVLQAGDNVQFQGQQIKTVKQLRQTRTMPENELHLSHKGPETKPAMAHMNPSQIARVASVQGQPQELKPGVKRTVMQRANSGSGDGPHVGTKVRVIKLSGGVSYQACLSFASMWLVCLWSVSFLLVSLAKCLARNDTTELNRIHKYKIPPVSFEVAPLWTVVAILYGSVFP